MVTLRLSTDIMRWILFLLQRFAVTLIKSLMSDKLNVPGHELLVATSTYIYGGIMVKYNGGSALLNSDI